MIKIGSYRISPIIFLLLGVIAISFSPIFTKWSAAPVSVLGMYRLLFTCILMFPFILKYINFFKKILIKEWVLLFVSSFFLYLHFLLWMESLKYTSVASATVLMCLEPIFVMIGAFFVFKERTNIFAVISMIIAISGAVLFGWADIEHSGIISNENVIIGDVLSLLGTVAFAVHILLGQNLLSKIPAVVYSFFVFFCASGIFASYNLIKGYRFTGYSEDEWLIFIALAVVPTVFGHVLFNWLLKYISATTVSMTILGETIGASVLSFIFFNEGLTNLQIVGGILVLLGVWFFIKNKTKPATVAERSTNDLTK